jgi:hypothetical protein
LAAGNAGAVLDRFAAPGVCPHINPQGAVKRADPALNAPGRLGNDMPGRQCDPPVFILFQEFLSFLNSHLVIIANFFDLYCPFFVLTFQSKEELAN